MKNKVLALGMLVTSVLLIAGPVFAHHAWGGYDMKNLSTIKGTVSQFDWGNPHVWINFDVKDDKGNVEKWSAGGPSPSRMAGTGWSKDTLSTGDQITAVGNRIKDGTLKMRLDKVVLADGRELECYGKHFGP